MRECDANLYRANSAGNFRKFAAHTRAPTQNYGFAALHAKVG